LAWFTETWNGLFRGIDEEVDIFFRSNKEIQGIWEGRNFRYDLVEERPVG